MAILTRVSRLLAADVHAVLDRLEEPQAQLQQALREMNALLQQTQQAQQQQQAQLTILEQREVKLTQQHTAAQTELELCLDANKSDLARSVIRRRLQIERLQEQLSQEQRLGAQWLQKLSQELAEQQQQLDSLAQQAEMTNSNLDPAPTATATGSPVSEADIDIALLAEQQRRQQQMDSLS